MSQQINLFNPIFLARRKVFSARTMAGALGIVAIALTGVHGLQQLQLVALQRQSVETNNQFVATQRMLTQFAADKKTGPSKVLIDQVSRLETQLSAQQTLLDSFASGTLGNTEGFARYMSALARQTLTGVWLTGFAATGAEGVSVIRGRLQQPDLLPNYLRLLNREEALRGHGFAELRIHAADPRAAAADGNTSTALEFTLGATKPAAGAGR